jgi:hypothetical protein
MSENKIRHKNFIDEEIEVGFNTPPTYSKEPTCPDSFIWRKKPFQIVTYTHTWFDFERHGRMTQNMKPEDDARARIKGSWGVGRFYFQVITREGRQFEIYFDRAPSNASDRGGHWFLLAELDSDLP